MSFREYILVGTIALGLFLLSSLQVNPLKMWAAILEYFSRGLDEPWQRSRIDRQRDLVALALFLAFVAIPAAILIWFTR